MLLRSWDIWKLFYYFCCEIFIETELCMSFQLWRRSTLNLIFIYWFNDKYHMRGLRVLQNVQFFHLKTTRDTHLSFSARFIHPLPPHTPKIPPSNHPFIPLLTITPQPNHFSDLHYLKIIPPITTHQPAPKTSISHPFTNFHPSSTYHILILPSF